MTDAEAQQHVDKLGHGYRITREFGPTIVTLMNEHHDRKVDMNGDIPNTATLDVMVKAIEINQGVSSDGARGR
jgi:hypothetical protein